MSLESATHFKLEQLIINGEELLSRIVNADKEAWDVLVNDYESWNNRSGSFLITALGAESHHCKAYLSATKSRSSTPELVPLNSLNARRALRLTDKIQRKRDTLQSILTSLIESEGRAQSLIGITPAQKEKIYHLLEHDEIESCFSLLLASLEKTNEGHYKILLMKSRLERLKMEHNQGVLSVEEWHRGLAKIRLEVVTFVNGG